MSSTPAGVYFVFLTLEIVGRVPKSETIVWCVWRACAREKERVGIEYPSPSLSLFLTVCLPLPLSVFLTHSVSSLFTSHIKLTKTVSDLVLLFLWSGGKDVNTGWFLLLYTCSTTLHSSLSLSMYPLPFYLSPTLTFINLFPSLFSLYPLSSPTSISHSIYLNTSLSPPLSLSSFLPLSLSLFRFSFFHSFPTSLILSLSHTLMWSGSLFPHATKLVYVIFFFLSNHLPYCIPTLNTNPQYFYPLKNAKISMKQTKNTDKQNRARKNRNKR